MSYENCPSDVLQKLPLSPLQYLLYNILIYVDHHSELIKENSSSTIFIEL